MIKLIYFLVTLYSIQAPALIEECFTNDPRHMEIYQKIRTGEYQIYKGDGYLYISRQSDHQKISELYFKIENLHGKKLLKILYMETKRPDRGKGFSNYLFQQLLKMHSDTVIIEGSAGLIDTNYDVLITSLAKLYKSKINVPRNCFERPSDCYKELSKVMRPQQIHKIIVENVPSYRSRKKFGFGRVCRPRVVTDDPETLIFILRTCKN